MSTKSKKTTTVTTSSSSSSFTSPVGGGTLGQAQRSRSPLSPTRYSRLQEKAELQNLNDRLACYMDKVRSLEAENTRLSREVRISQESITREVSAFRSMYDQELSDARRLLDDIAKERAQAEIDNKRLSEENDDLKSSLEKKTKECRSLEANLNICEHRATDLQTKYNQAISDKKKLEEELKEANKELDKLRKSYELTKKYIENETLTRVELENKLQSLKEEMNFKDQMFNKEITELRTKRREEISEIDGRLTVEYEDKLQAALQELREQHEQQQLANREEIAALYENKIKAMRDHYDRNSAALQSSAEELRSAQAKYHSLNSQVSELQSANQALQHRIRDLEKLLENERNNKLDQLTQLEQELSRLRNEMADQLKDYHDLMDIKVALDTEISAYRKLLEFEENRLNITPASVTTAPTASTTRRGTPVRRTPVPKAAKRRKLLVEERNLDEFEVKGDSKTDVIVNDVDPNGQFIQLYNKGDKEIALSGWSIKHSAGGDDKETTFKFHRSVKIEPKGTVNVWSAESNHPHTPPEHILMKQKWFTADEMITVLVNNEGEEVASRQRRRMLYSTSYRTEREGSEDTQDGDPKSQESCVIM